MISQLSAKYQFCTVHTADIIDGESPSNPRKSIVSEKVHRLYPPRASQRSRHAVSHDKLGGSGFYTSAEIPVQRLTAIFKKGYHQAITTKELTVENDALNRLF